MTISAQSHQGLTELLRVVKKIVETERAKQPEAEPEAAVPHLTLNDQQLAWNVVKQGDIFVVSGKKIEKFAARTNFDNEDGVIRIRDIMKKMGIMHALVRQGINPGDTIQIGHHGHITY